MEGLQFPSKFLRKCARGETVFREGTVGQHMYVVAAGRVDITVARKDGREGEDVVASLAKGDIFGEMALVDSLPRSASATAAEDGTQLLEIDHPLFVYLVGQQPAFALMVQKSLSRRLRGLSGKAGEGGGAEGQADATKPSEPIALQEGVFLLRGRCNCYLVRGTRKNLLVDTGLPWETGILEGQLNALGLAKEDVHVVALTHEHLDHIGGVPFFSRRATVAAHTLAANKIRMQDEFVLMSKAFRLDPEAYHVDLHVHHGTRIDLGGCSLMVLHTPGHSSGSTCLYEADRGLLFSGDTIFGGGILGGIFPSGALSDYTLTLRQLATMRLSEIYPGHGKKSVTPGEDIERAVRGSVSLMNDTRSLFNVFDSREEFAHVSKGVSAYAKRV